MGTVELTCSIRHCQHSNRKCTYRVGDDQDVGVGGGVSSSLGEVTDDRSVGVEEVFTSQFVSI